MIVRRVKNGRVHYATDIEPANGSITGFSERKEDAVEVNEQLAAKLQEHYAKRTKNGQPCGVISLVDFRGVPPKPKPINHFAGAVA